MALKPIRPLRFYEIWMLKFLSRSPRIHQIIVAQDALPIIPGSPEAVQFVEGAGYSGNALHSYTFLLTYWTCRTHVSQSHRSHRVEILETPAISVRLMRLSWES
jgi:hypothetical protein